MTGILTPEPYARDERVVWVRARDTQLSGQAHGAPVGPDDRPIGAEAALLLTFRDTWTEAGEGTEVDQDVTVVVHGSRKRLLKTLDYARHQLIESAPTMRRVVGDPETEELFTGPVPADYDPDEVAEGLQCPHCEAVTWDGEEAGVRLVSAGETWTPCGYSLGRGGPAPRLVHGRVEDVELGFDRFECESCERIVNLPDEVRS